MNTSWKPEVLVDGEWTSNSLRFDTELEAKASAKELMSRWITVNDGRSSQSNDPVNYRFDFKTNRNIAL